VGDSKALPIFGGVLLILFLPLLIVIAMIVGALSGMDSAAANCTPSDTVGKTFAWPTDRHEVDQGWSEGGGRGQSPHHGIDFDVDEGSKVYAAEDGEIVATSDNQVRIKHDKGVETRYKYLKDITVQVGKQVKRGDQIGTSGSGDEATPGLTGDHLHFELWIDQKDDGNLVNTKPEDDSFGDDTEDSGSGCSCGTDDLNGSNNQQKAFNYLVSNGYSKEQAAGIVGNMINESNVEPQLLNGNAPGTVTNPSDAVGINKAWGLVQWYPGAKMIEPSRQAGVDDAVIGSLAYQLEFLNKQLLGKGPLPEKAAGDAVKAATTVEDAAFQFGFKFERFTTNANDPEFNERKADARSVFDRFAGSAPAEGGGGAGGCGAGNGDIVQTALALAWDTPNHGYDPKPGYRDAQQKYNGSTGEDELTDCGVFVATVMVMSGVDKDYARRGTTAQMDYLRSSAKYQIFDNLTNESQLRPGDIFIIDGHTYLYTGNYEGGDGKTYNAASASLHGHVPEASHVYFSDYRGHYTVARIKQSGASD
jgi:murein DD-endopeptidase MepM/ murein hydrolase activator NlpD